MKFEPPYLGRSVVVLTFALGCLTSTCLASSETVPIDCEEIDESGSSSNLSRTPEYLIYIRNFVGDVNCSDILYEGKYTRLENGSYTFGLLKKEISGWECHYLGFVEDYCVDMLKVRINYFGFLCTPWTESTDGRALQLADIPESPEAFAVGRLMWKNTTASYVLDCDMSIKILGKTGGSFTMSLINLTLSAFSPVPVCGILIAGRVIKHVESTVSGRTIVDFKLRRETGYTCTFGDGLRILKSMADGIYYRIYDSTIDCEESNLQEKMNLDTHPVLKNELIMCDFENFRKMSNDRFMYNSSTQMPFIYIDKNEKRGQLMCWQLIKGGTVKNYGNNLLEFKLYKKEFSGFECQLDEPTFLKKYRDSHMVLTKFTGLICAVWERKRSPAARMTKKTIECNFHTTFMDNDCMKRNVTSTDLLNVWTSEDVQCSSIIVDDRVIVKDNIAYFRLYKPEFSGYTCNIGHLEIKREQKAWLVVERPNKMLNCEQYKRIVKLTCWIIGWSHLYYSLRPFVKINVETTKNVQCSDIIIYGLTAVENMKSEKYSPALLIIYLKNDGGFKCDLENVNYKKLETYKAWADIYKLIIDIGNELNCSDFVPAKPESTLTEFRSEIEEGGTITRTKEIIIDGTKRNENKTKEELNEHQIQNDNDTFKEDEDEQPFEQDEVTADDPDEELRSSEVVDIESENDIDE